jgi:hypothetical protein
MIQRATLFVRDQKDVCINLPLAISAGHTVIVWVEDGNVDEVVSIVDIQGQTYLKDFKKKWKAKHSIAGPITVTVSFSKIQKFVGIRVEEW